MTSREEEPFEGAHDMSLMIALGSVTVFWPKYDFQLFRLFQVLSIMQGKKARVVWYNMPSLDAKLRIMQQLAEEGGYDAELTKQILDGIKRARELSLMRNRWTHWWWSRDDDGWSLRGMKKPDDAKQTSKLTIDEIHDGRLAIMNHHDELEALLDKHSLESKRLM